MCKGNRRGKEEVGSTYREKEADAGVHGAGTAVQGEPARDQAAIAGEVQRTRASCDFILWQP